MFQFNPLQDYIDYIRDNPKKYWFKRKLYGWGWTPVRWQGWVVLIVSIAVVILDFNRIDASSHSSSDTLINFIPHVILFTIVIVLICYKKGESPKWQWGIPKKKNK